jgi:hypothetical protein
MRKETQFTTTADKKPVPPVPFLESRLVLDAWVRAATLTTIQDIVAEAEIEGSWIRLPRLDDLSDYEMVFRDATSTVVGGKKFSSPEDRVESLPSFWNRVKNVPLQRGVGYQGWLRFELTSKSTNLEKPVNHKVRLIDALGGVHPVVSLGGLSDTQGEIRHSPKTYEP